MREDPSSAHRSTLFNLTTTCCTLTRVKLGKDPRIYTIQLLKSFVHEPLFLSRMWSAIERRIH